MRREWAATSKDVWDCSGTAPECGMMREVAAGTRQNAEECARARAGMRRGADECTGRCARIGWRVE